MKLRLFIDARMVTPIPHGFSRYVSAMVQSLEARHALKDLPYTIHLLVPMERVREWQERTPFECVGVEAPFLSLREIFEIPGVLFRNGADFYHSPTFSSLWFCPCPWAVTIHDLNHLTYGGLGEKLYYRFLLKRFAKKARTLMTVSAFSQAEIAAWLGCSRELIEVVPNVLLENLLEMAPAAKVETLLKRLGLRKGEFFVCLSNSKPHKNLSLLENAYRLYKKSVAPQSPAWPLILSVSGGSSEDWTLGVLKLGGLSDEDGRILVQNAGALVFPSLYEGFGLPPVEGIIAGAPVVVSEIPPHREGLVETTGKEVLWVDPRNGEAWAKALTFASQGGVIRPSEAVRRATLARFGLAKMGENLDRIYQKMTSPRVQ